MAKNRQIFAILKATLFALVLSFSSLNAFSGDSCDFYLSDNSENCVVRCEAGYIVRQQGGAGCILLNDIQNNALIEYMVISGYFNFLRKYPEYSNLSLYAAAQSYLQKSGSTIKDLLYSSDHFVLLKSNNADVCPVDSYKDLMQLNFADDCKTDPSVGSSFWYMIHPNSMATNSGDNSVKYNIYDTPILDYKYNTNGTVDLKENTFVLNETVETQVKEGAIKYTGLPPIALCPMGTKITGTDKYVESCNGVDTGASYDIIIYTDQTPFTNVGIIGFDRFILREVFGKGWTAVIEDKNGVVSEIVLADYSATSGMAQDDKSLFYMYGKETPLIYPAALGLQDMLNAMFLAYEEYFTVQMGTDVKFSQTDKDAIIYNLTQEKELHEMLNSSTFGRSTRLHANILYNNTGKSTEITYDNIPHHTSLTKFQCNSNCAGVEDTGNKERFDDYPEGGGEKPTSTVSITLNWNENGGSAIANGSCTLNENLTLPSAPTRSGYTFNGWKLANGTIKSAGETVSSGCTSTYTGVSSGTSTSITAQWTASGGGIGEPSAGGDQCEMYIENPGCTGDICMNNYKNTGFSQENQWCYVNNYYFTDDSEYINPYTSIKNGITNINYWSNSENDFVPLDVFHGEHEIGLETSVLWENNHSFLSAGTTQIGNKNDMTEYSLLLDNIYSSNGDYDNTFVLPDLPYCDGYVFNGYDGGYDGAGVFVSCSGQTLTANYTSLDGTITIGSNSYELEHLSNIAPLALNLEDDPDATYRFVCDSSSYELDYCNNQYVIDYLGNIHHPENEYEYAYISPLAVFMMTYEVPSSGSYFSADCGGQTLMECFGIGLDGNLPNGGNLYDYSRESVEEFMKMVFEYDNWGFGVSGNSPQFAPDSRQYQLMKLVNQYGIMRQNMVFENLGSGSGGTTPTPTTITLNWDENGGNAIANGSCTLNGNLTLPSAPTRSGYIFNGWKLADDSIHNAGETITSGCTETYIGGIISSVATGIQAQWTLDSCGAGEYKNGNECSPCPEGFRDGTNADNVYMCYKSGAVNCSDYVSMPNAVITTQNISAMCKTYYGTDICVLDNPNSCNIISFNCDTGYEEQDIPLSATTDFSNFIIKTINASSCLNYLAENELAVNEVDCDGDGFDKVAPGNWAFTYDNGTLYGNSLCSATAGTQNVAGNPDTTTSGDNCWCRTERFNDESVMSSWISFDVASCESNCAQNCSLGFVMNQTFRESLFNNILTKECKPEVYTISFITNGGGTIEDIQYTYGSPAITLPEPTKANNVFDGWYSDSELTNAVSSPYTPTGSITLYAKWTDLTGTLYTVNYYVSDIARGYMGEYNLYFTETKSGSDNETILLSDLATTIPGFEYAFGVAGTSTYGPNEPQSGYVTSTTILPDGNRVIDLYYVRQQYNIDITKNGVSAVSVMGEHSSGPYYYGDNITITATTGDGYTWNNWTFTDDGTEFSTSNPYTFTMGAGDMALTANATPNTYHIVLDNQGATTAGTSEFWYIYSTHNPCGYYTSGTEFDSNHCLGENGYTIVMPEKTGYTFGGYWTEQNGNGTQYIFNDGRVNPDMLGFLTENKTLYAKWTPATITINWDENGGNAIANGSCIYGGNLTLPSTPTRDGYTFAGWKLADGTIKISGGTVSGGCTETYIGGIISSVATGGQAQWTQPSCPINYHSDQSLTEIMGTSAAGVDYVANGSDGGQIGSYSGLSSDVAGIYGVQYAFAVYYGADKGYVRGRGVCSTQTGTSYTVINTSLPDNSGPNCYCQLYNYTSSGVNISSGSLLLSSYDDAGQCANNCSVNCAYAMRDDSQLALFLRTLLFDSVCSPDVYRITYNTNGGNTIDPYDYTYGSSAITLPEPTRPEYTFAGWYSDSELTNLVSGPYTPTQSVTLYAKWTNNIIHCDAGYYLPANATQCSKCDYIDENKWCTGGDFEISSEPQGFQNCPEIQNYGDAAAVQPSYAVLFGPVDYNNNNIKDTERDCGVLFGYSYDRDNVGSVIDSGLGMGIITNNSYSLSYNTNSAYNRNIAWAISNCLYNPDTGLYDYCLPSDVWVGVVCKNGYYVPQNKIHTNFNSNSSENFFGEFDTEICVPAESGYYTNLYDLHKNDENNALANKVGVGTSPLSGAYRDIITGSTDEFTNLYKQCPDAYPDSDIASWQVAQCYATVTFMDGSTELKTEQHDFDGTSDGVTVTTNAYHISDYQPTKTGYVFVGWFETATLTGNLVTTTTDLTGNKTLYAKWEKERIKCPDVDNSSFGALRVSSNDTADSLEDCTARFMYANSPDNVDLFGSLFNGEEISADYDANNSINSTVYDYEIVCKYNTITGLYDLCIPATFYLASCARGYYIGNPEYELSLYNGGFDSFQYNDSHRSPCVPAERGYYTNSYDKSKSTEDVDEFTGVTASAYASGYTDHSFPNIFTNFVDINNSVFYANQDELYKKCPDAYPDSEPASWQIAQCYATVTFMDGNTELKTEQHDFSGTSDGVTVTTNAYHISDYQPTKTNYVFDGWYETSDFSGNKITTATDLTGNKTLYAKWESNIIHCNVGYYLPAGSRECAECENGYYCPDSRDYDYNETTPQGNVKCPAITNVEEGFYYFAPDEPFTEKRFSGETNLRDNVGDCFVNVLYTNFPSDITVFTGYTQKENYNPNLDVNKTSFYYNLYCMYNSSTDAYNRCMTLEKMCKKGYYVPQSEIDYLNNALQNNEFGYPTPCLPAESGYYTNVYDMSGLHSAVEPYKDKIGVGTTGYAGTYGYDDYTATDKTSFSDWYKKCPDAYPDSDIASWQVAQCYATVTFMDSSTELKTEQHDFSGTSDGVNVTTNAYHISDYQPTKTDYVFDGWYETSDFSGNKITTATDLTGNKTLYAKWTPINYDIIYELYGGVVSGTNPTTYNIETPTFTLENPTKANHEFMGWCENNADCDNPVLTYIIEQGSTGNKTLYAQWKLNVFNIKYYDGANELSEITPVTYIYSDDSQTITPIEPEKRGYTFNGWCLNSDNCDDSQKTLVIVGGTIGDINAYAQWTPNVYNINYYDWENELGGVYPNTYTYSASENQTITPNKPIKNGYQFIGWCVGTDDCEETINTLDIPADTIGNIDLYAKWVMTINIHFDKNTQKDVVGMPNDVICVDGQNCVSNQTPVLNNYEFNSWNLESDGSGNEIVKGENDEYDLGVLFYWIGAENVTLYAQWTPVDYTITYILNDGVVSGTNPTLYNAETPTFTLNNPTKNGYEFVGWCETENCTNPEIEYSFDTSVGGNKTLYAIFTPIQYTIVFNANGGNGEKAPVTCYYDTNCDISNNEIERTGYDFMGWSRNTSVVEYPQTQSGISVFNLTNVPETIFVNAIWDTNSLPLKYNYNDGTDIINDSCVYDTSFVPTVPTRPGYIFAGWDVTSE